MRWVGEKHDHRWDYFDLTIDSRLHIVDLSLLHYEVYGICSIVYGPWLRNFCPPLNVTESQKQIYLLSVTQRILRRHCYSIITGTVHVNVPLSPIPSQINFCVLSCRSESVARCKKWELLLRGDHRRHWSLSPGVVHRHRQPGVGEGLLRIRAGRNGHEVVQ